VPSQRRIQSRKFMSAALIAAFALCLLSASAIAQDTKDTNPGVSSTAQTSSAEVAKASKEAGAQDEQAEFKHSSSVQLVARLTGLSLDHAYWLCVLLNFSIIAGAIVWASKKRLPGVFRERTASIQQSIDEARKASEEANRRLSHIDARLSQLGSEIEGMKVSAEKEAVDEEARIKSAAIEDARKIVQSAEQEIAAAARTARRDLTAYAADLAVSLARKQIHVDGATDEGLIRDFAQQLDTHGPAKGES
jgi:F-type H+-transporting ATPase subunit b